MDLRNLTLTGHLGNDPEVKTTSNGRQYTTFRLANHVYTDPENTTYWYTITVWDTGLQKLCQSFKKGSYVYVIGLPTDRTYKSNKTGMDEIGRDIRAESAGFVGGNKRDDDAQAGQTAPAQVNVAPAANDQVSAKPAPEVTATAAPAADDDLPF